MTLKGLDPLALNFDLLKKLLTLAITIAPKWIGFSYLVFDLYLKNFNFGHYYMY